MEAFSAHTIHLRCAWIFIAESLQASKKKQEASLQVLGWLAVGSLDPEKNENDKICA